MITTAKASDTNHKIINYSTNDPPPPPPFFFCVLRFGEMLTLLPSQ